MLRYKNPYRLDAAIVANLLEHLNMLIHASNEATEWDHDARRVPLLTQLPHSPSCFGFMKAHQCLVCKRKCGKASIVTKTLEVSLDFLMR